MEFRNYKNQFRSNFPNSQRKLFPTSEFKARKPLPLARHSREIDALRRKAVKDSKRRHPEQRGILQEFLRISS